MACKPDFFCPFLENFADTRFKSCYQQLEELCCRSVPWKVDREMEISVQEVCQGLCDFMIWWIWQNPAYDEQLWLHGQIPWILLDHTVHKQHGYLYLFNASSVVYILWWVLTWNTMNFTLDVHSYRSIHVPLPQTSLSLIFQTYPSRPLTNQPSHSPLPTRSMCLLTMGPLSLHKRWMTGCTIQSLSTGRISSSTVFQGHCSGACSIATVYFWLTHTYWADPPMNKAWLFFSSCRI